MRNAYTDATRAGRQQLTAQGKVSARLLFPLCLLRPLCLQAMALLWGSAAPASSNTRAQRMDYRQLKSYIKK